MDEIDTSTEDSYWMPDALVREKGKGIYHHEWRSYLNEVNRKEVTNLLEDPKNIQRFVLYTRHVADYFQIVTRELLLPPEVLYLSMDIFDRFWVNQVGQNRGRQSETLMLLKTNPPAFRRDVCLISLTCIQLASKQCYTNKVLPVPVILEIMKKFGFAVEKQEVRVTELTLLKTIRWAIPNVTILTYVEMFIEELSSVLPVGTAAELIQVCIKVLNITFSFHQDIYTKMHIAFKRRELRTDREKTLYLSVEGDLIRLAASVVCTSGMLYDPTNKLAEIMIDHFSKTTSYQPVEIRVLSQILVHIILRKMEVHPV